MSMNNHRWINSTWQCHWQSGEIYQSKKESAGNVCGIQFCSVQKTKKKKPLTCWGDFSSNLCYFTATLYEIITIYEQELTCYYHSSINPVAADKRSPKLMEPVQTCSCTGGA